MVDFETTNLFSHCQDVNESIKQETVGGSVLPEEHDGDENIKQETVEGSLLPGGQNNDIPSSSNAAESGWSLVLLSFIYQG